MHDIKLQNHSTFKIKAQSFMLVLMYVATRSGWCQMLVRDLGGGCSKLSVINYFHYCLKNSLTQLSDISI